MEEESSPSAPAPQGIVPLICVRGFIATIPKLDRTDPSAPRFYARFGVLPPQSGTLRSEARPEPTFHSLVAYRRAALVAFERFRKGDRFIAEGSIRTTKRSGKEIFEFTNIGHNALSSDYEIVRDAQADTLLHHQELNRSPFRSATPMPLVLGS